MSYYIPSNSLNREDCEALHTRYNKKGRLGSGAYGEVYQACIKGGEDCSYVLKVITYDEDKYRRSGRSLEDVFFAWRNEVKVFKTLNEYQDKFKLVFSPILYDSWYCGEGDKMHFYILMEKYDGDLSDLVESSPDQKLVLAISLRLMDSYLFIIHNNFGICLNDIKLQNILYKRTGPMEYSLVFSDFGKSTMYSDDRCIEIDRENFKGLMASF
jgi:serine/threonine protein kinase